MLAAAKGDARSRSRRDLKDQLSVPRGLTLSQTTHKGRGVHAPRRDLLLSFGFLPLCYIRHLSLILELLLLQLKGHYLFLLCRQSLTRRTDYNLDSAEGRTPGVLTEKFCNSSRASPRLPSLRCYFTDPQCSNTVQLQRIARAAAPFHISLSKKNPQHRRSLETVPLLHKPHRSYISCLKSYKNLSSSLTTM